MNSDDGSRLIDISPVIDASIGVWPGDTPFVRNVNLDISAGANLTLSDIRTTLHVGAHTDAPSHYLAGGEPTSQPGLSISSSGAATSSESTWPVPRASCRGTSPER